MRPPALRALCLVALVLSGTRCPAELEALAPEKINEVDGIERVYIAHRISNEKGKLLPEHCFFSGDSKKLKLSGPTKVPAADPLNLNGGNSYRSVDGLQSPDQRVVWPLWFSSETALHGLLVAKGSGSLKVSLGASAQTVSVEGGVAVFKFERAPKGESELRVSPTAFSGSIERVELEGPALKEAKLLRARWRPGAIHSSFISSNFTARPTH